MHFVPYVAATLLLLFALLGGIYLSFGRYTSDDVTEYHEMLEDASRDARVDRIVSSQHLRQNLQKDLHIVKPHGQVLFRLKSQDARLSLERTRGSTDVVETMEGVTCWLQEDLMYRFSDGTTVASQDPLWGSLVPVAIAMQAIPLQRMVYVEADKAMYDYDAEKFVANNAKVWRYVMPGHIFSEAVDKEKALISGIAEHVVITFGSQGLNFKAEGFNASISLSGAK